ncbi:MAG: hypothetical protein JW943_16215 [Deltaproteobacteria bacterium]|nr:hypothetical protein [Deltaproteobacteria bacterium]
MKPIKKKLQDPRHHERDAEDEWNEDDFSIGEEDEIDKWDDLSLDDLEELDEMDEMDEWDEDSLMDDGEDDEDEWD